jgi:hypothetical protein
MRMIQTLSLVFLNPLSPSHEVFVMVLLETSSTPEHRRQKTFTSVAGPRSRDYQLVATDGQHWKHSTHVAHP